MFITSAPPLPQWPTGSVVGYENYPGFTGSLIDGSGITVQSDTTYVGYLNLGNGSLGTESVAVENVTCIGCCWTGSGLHECNVLLYGSNFRFAWCTTQPGPFADWPPSSKESHVPQLSGYQYGIVADGTEVAPGTFNTWATGIVASNCDFWGFGNAGMRISNGSSQMTPYIVDYNYLHNLRSNDDMTDHNDGIGSPGGGAISYLQLVNNSISAAGDTNAIIWGAAGSFVDHCLISGNLLGGFGFTLALLNDVGQVSDLTFTNNTYTTAIQPFFGPLYSQDLLNSPGLTWRGNRWLVPPGAQWGHAQYSGYFWLPGFTSNASPTLDELAHGLVGTVDFM